MQNLGEFVEGINEERKSSGRGAGWNDEPTPMRDVDVDQMQDKVVMGGKPAPATAVNNAAKPGKSAKDNGSKGVWAVEPPSISDADPSNNKYMNDDLSKLTKNERKLANRIANDADFMVVGEAGWGKTSVITDVAHKFGKTIITVYLDKAQPSDLSGIPVPTEDDKTGAAWVNNLVPAWALVMLQNPDTPYLLFFDEMNQAADDVQNALMPIIQKKVICGIEYDNYIVGAAGNLAWENARGVSSDLSLPLRQRLMPFTWEARTPEEWASHFTWAHKHYDDKIGPEVINKVAELKDYWNSPRDLEKKIYKWCETTIRNKRVFLDVDDLYEEVVDGAVWKDEGAGENKMRGGVDVNARKFQETMKEFCQWLITWAKNGGKAPEAEKTRSRAKDGKNIDKSQKEVIINALEAGYFWNSKGNNPNGDDKKYLCTVENVVTRLFNPEVTGITAEVLPSVIRDMKASGQKPKYETDADGASDAKKNGWIVLTE